MKVFFATLSLFALMLLLILCNALYVNRMTTHLLDEIRSLPDDPSPTCGATVEKINEEWKQHRPFVLLSVSDSVIDRISEQMSALLSAAVCGDVCRYRIARDVLTDALEDLQKPERLSLKITARGLCGGL